MPDHYPVTLDYFVRRQTWPGWNIPLRRIRNYELVYVLDGEGNITLRGKPLHLIPGDLILFRPGEAHSLTVTQAPCMVFYGIHFSPLQETPMLSLPDRMHISLRSGWKFCSANCRRPTPPGMVLRPGAGIC